MSHSVSPPTDSVTDPVVTGVSERRTYTLRLDVEVPEDRRVDRAQPFTDHRRYRVERVKVKVSEDYPKDRFSEKTSITFYGPLITKAGLSSKVLCDEKFWTFDEGLAACSAPVRAALEQRIESWRSSLPPPASEVE